MKVVITKNHASKPLWRIRRQHIIKTINDMTRNMYGLKMNAATKFPCKT